MATLTERLILLITADSKGAVAGLEATGAAADKSLTPIEAKARSATAGVATVGLAGVAAGGALALGLKGADDAFKNLALQTLGIQRITGDTAEGASQLIFIAERMGVPFDALNTSLIRLGKNSSKLSDIGVAVNNATGQARPFVDVLGDIADYFQNAPAGFNKTAEAVALFGRSGTKMLPILNQGREGIAELSAEADKMGFTLGQSSIEQVLKHMKAQRELEHALQATKTQIGAAIDPAYTKFLEGVASTVGAVAKFLHQHPLAAEVGADIAGVGAGVAVIGGALALGSFAVQKIAKGYSDFYAVLRRGRTTETIVETEELTAANERLAASEEAAAAAAARLAEADAAAAAGAGAAGATAAAPAVAGVGAAVAAEVKAGSSAAVTSLAEVDTAAAATGEQLTLAFGSGMGQLELFDAAAVGAAGSIKLIEKAMTEATGLVGTEAAVMSAELKSALAGGALGADFFAAPKVAVEEVTTESAVMRAQLASAFTSGIVPVEAFDGAVLKSAADMELLGDAAVAAYEKERLAAAAATAAAEKDAAARAATKTGGGSLGVISKVATPVLLTVIGVQVGEALGNGLTGADDKLDAALLHLKAKATTGGKDVAKAFRDAANKQGAEFSASDLLPTHIWDEIFNGFKLGGKGEEHPADTFQKVFDSALSTSTDRAQNFLDVLKAEDAGLNHNSDDYKQSEALRRKWQKAVDDAREAEGSATDGHDAESKALDGLGFKIDSTKNKYEQYASSLQNLTSPVKGVFDAKRGLQDAGDKLSDDKAKLASDLTGQGKPADLAGDADRVATSNRSAASATREANAATSDLAAARAELAHIDQASDPTRYAAALDKVTAAEDRQKSATDKVTDAKATAATAEADLAAARLNGIEQANAEADAYDRIASAVRGVNSAKRELDNANRDLAEKQAELAHVDPAKAPNTYRQLSGEVADLRDQQLNAQDRVAEAQQSQRSAQRSLLEQQAKKTSEDANKIRDDLKAIQADQQAYAEAGIAYAEAFANLGGALKDNPDLLAKFNGLLDDLAKKGLLPANVVSAVKDQVSGLKDELSGLLDLIDKNAGVSPSGSGGGKGQKKTTVSVKPGGSIPDTRPGASPSDRITFPSKALSAKGDKVIVGGTTYTYDGKNYVANVAPKAETPALTSASSASSGGGGILSNFQNLVGTSAARDQGAFIRQFPVNPPDATPFSIAGYSFVYDASRKKWIGADLEKAYEKWRVQGYADGGVLDRHTGTHRRYADGGTLGAVHPTPPPLPKSSRIEHGRAGGIVAQYAEAGDEAHIFIPTGGGKVKQAGPVLLEAAARLGAFQPGSDLGDDLRQRLTINESASAAFANGGILAPAGSFVGAVPTPAQIVGNVPQVTTIPVGGVNEKALVAAVKAGVADAVRGMRPIQVIQPVGAQQAQSSGAVSRAVRAGIHLAGG